MKLSSPLDPVGPSLMTHNRALHNPPVAIPRTGIPSGPTTAIATDYLLVCEARSSTLADGTWRFTIEAADGSLILEADDDEFGDVNRLTLLAAVRGLEALEGPSDVTLLSNNRYLIRSLANSLPRWRQNDFVWEHFGRRVEVQNADLWRRIDRTLDIHRVQACLVSSCLVSRGDSALPHNEAQPGGSIRRIDGPHHQSESGGVPAPSDRLRRLLLGRSRSTDPAPSEARRRGRFTAQDLDLESNDC